MEAIAFILLVVALWLLFRDAADGVLRGMGLETRCTDCDVKLGQQTGIVYVGSRDGDDIRVVCNRCANIAMGNPPSDDSPFRPLDRWEPFASKDAPEERD